jgi:Zn-dependent protease with chaperone function
MDLTSWYLRSFFGAKGVRSPELDSLAERMGVLPLLSRDPADRYLITKAKSITALSLGNKVVFGRSYYDLLTDAQRLAVSAHEFAHMLEKERGRWSIAWSTLAISSLLTVGTFLALHSVLLSESVFCLSFFGTIRILSSREVERGKLQELRCDNLATSFVGGEPMIASLRLAVSIRNQSPRRSFLRRLSKSPMSAVEERISAIDAFSQK